MSFSWNDPPPDVVLVNYTNNRYTFTYPDGGRFATFDSPTGLIILRLLVPVSRQFLSFDLRCQPAASVTAHQAADAFFAEREDLFARANVAPFPLTIAGCEGWRTRRRFVDGVSAPLLLDAAFIQDGDTLHRLFFAVAPIEYAAHRWIFDLLLRTLTLVDQAISP